MTDSHKSKYICVSTGIIAILIKIIYVDIACVKTAYNCKVSLGGQKQQIQNLIEIKKINK